MHNVHNPFDPNSWTYSNIYDADGDTGINVERTADDDTIRFDLGGATPITDAALFSQANGFWFNTNQDDLDVCFDTVNERNTLYVNAGTDGTGFGTDETRTNIEGNTNNAKVFTLKPDNVGWSNHMIAFGGNANGRAPDLQFLRARGSWASPTVVQVNSRIGELKFGGYDGANFVQGAAIRVNVDGAVSGSTVPMGFEFRTSPSNGAAQSRRFGISSGGDVTVGSSAASPDITFKQDGSGIFTGSMTYAYVAKTSAYTVTATDHTIDCTSGTFTVTLLTAVGIDGMVFNIKNSGTGTITLDGDGTETIDGSTTAAIAAGQCLTVQSTGSNWIII